MNGVDYRHKSYDADMSKYAKDHQGLSYWNNLVSGDVRTLTGAAHLF